MKQKEYFIERHKGGERAILVHVDFPPIVEPERLAELKELARSAGVQILEVITAKRERPDSKFYVGTGKADEIAHAVQACKAEVVLFNHELTASQGRNLEKLCECRVLDRTELILDIFAQRAQTYEGKLQVELAQLQHLSTHLVRGWTHLERQKGGIGLRGPGETQLESDRRMVGQRIKQIKKRLDKVLQQRQLSRNARQRSALPTVSLVGYTNAGKSTLFNRLTEANVYAEDQLFATLDPTLRKIKLPGLGEVILADTVGFVRDLPHDLVAAFKATLEETVQADLLLHVVDCSAPDYKDTIIAVNEVLASIGAATVPVLQVNNKLDLRRGIDPHLDFDDSNQPWRVWLSAQTGEGVDLLNQALQQALSEQWVQQDVLLEPTQAKLRAQLYELGAVEHEEIDEQGNWQLGISLPRDRFERLFPQDRSGEEQW